MEYETTCIDNYSLLCKLQDGVQEHPQNVSAVRTYCMCDIRYKNFLGDGDSSAYPTIVQTQPYGPDFSIEKLECVGRIQKRMGSRLQELNTKLG